MPGLLLALALSTSSCSTVSYLFQASKGQFELFNRARPISEVIQDERTPPRVRALLAEIEPIKNYGESQGLKPTPNYRDYVKLDRPAAVWVVSACEPLQFKAKEWSFPIVGSFPYLGWFDLKDAKDYANQLRAKGWDADVRGAAAYSTLGWFRDAVLSTMIPKGDEALGDLVNTVLHESVHATLYINGQSYFDESIANFTADQMTPVYLEKKHGKNSPELKAYLKVDREYEEETQALHDAYEKLDQLYKSNLPDSEKLAKKKKFLADLKEKLGFRREINNATLIQFKTYNTGREDYEKLLKACDGDWHRFWAVLKTLSPKSFQKPQQQNMAPVIGPFTAAGCKKPS